MTKYLTLKHDDVKRKNLKQLRFYWHLKKLSKIMNYCHNSF